MKAYLYLRRLKKKLKSIYLKRKKALLKNSILKSNYINILFFHDIKIIKAVQRDRYKKKTLKEDFIVIMSTSHT